MALSHLLGRKTLIAHRTQGQRLIPLGQTFSASILHQRTMEKFGRRPLQRFVKKQLTASREQEVFAADNFCDAHRMIVHNRRQLIGGRIVLPLYDEVSKIDSGNGGKSPQVAVLKGNSPIVRNAESPVGSSLFFCRRFACVFPASSRIQGAFLAKMRRQGSCLDVFARAIAAIDSSQNNQPFQRVAIPVESGALPIRSASSFDVRAFMPTETKPAKVFQHCFQESRLSAGGVQIFHAKDELSVAFGRSGLRLPKGSGVSQVEIAGGRWRDSPAIFSL